jgi:peroxiredoxin
MFVMQRFAFGFLVLVTAAMVTRDASAAKLKIGDAGPEFAALTGTDDKPHGLSDYKDAKAVVVVFTCNHCPVAKAYQDRLVAVQKDYKDKAVQVVAICSNSGGADNLEAMKKRAEDAGFNFPYLSDSSQEACQNYGATCTPHVFILDKDRKVAYMGSIDDNQNSDEVEKHYVRTALDALLAGKTPDPAVTRQFGCGIH